MIASLLVLSVFALPQTSGLPPAATTRAAASTKIACRINALLMVEVGPIRCGRPSISTTASPVLPQLSMTRSAISVSFFPDECREVTTATYSELEMAMTRAPRAFASKAISMGTGLRPEFETINNRSPLAIG